MSMVSRGFSSVTRTTVAAAAMALCAAMLLIRLSRCYTMQCDAKWR